MSTQKFDYILRVFSRYRILVGFNGDVDRKNVPGPIERETFKSWCARVLEKEPSEVIIYTPTRLEPSSFNKHIATVQREVDDITLHSTIKMARSLERIKTLKRFPVEWPFPTRGIVSKREFNELINLISEDKPQHIKEYLGRIPENELGQIDLENVLKDIMDDFSDHVTRLRALQDEIAELKKQDQKDLPLHDS